MLRYSCVALLLAMLVMLWCGVLEADAAPTFGLLFARYNGNNTLLENILQAKILALNVLADYIDIASSTSGQCKNTRAVLDELRKRQFFMTITDTLVYSTIF